MAHPNIVYILADDQGYGDATCYNPNCKAPTPCMDRLAAGGVLFTDSHTSSSVCTPTRYSVMTGRYNWRSWMKAGVLAGDGAPLLEPGRETVASFLQRAGYRTACVGKWHLGLGWQKADGSDYPAGYAGDWQIGMQADIDYAAPVSSGPNDYGFDYSYVIPSSLDIPPYVYLENGRCTGIPSEETMLGVDTPFLMRRGPSVPGMQAIDVLPHLTDTVCREIDTHAAERTGQPLFVYFPLTAPHTPIIPAEEYKGRTDIGPYGDFVTQVDATIAQVVDALERNGMLENTLLIVTSDNGASPATHLDELKLLGHEPNWPWRGTKADLYEGGHRTPFIAHWPAVAPAGQVCDQTICTTDLMATAADIVGLPLPDDAGEDSYSLMPLLRGDAIDGDFREATVHHSVSGHFAIRQGKWKLLEARGSGGWSYPKEDEATAWGLPEYQLYNLEADPAEAHNVAPGHPDIVARLKGLLDRYRDSPRSAPAR